MKNKYDVAKLLTLLLVVFAHSSKMFTDQAAIDNFGINEALSYITSFIYSFHMPVFIAISGSVFSICMKSGKYSNIGKFVNNKARRLLIPYLFFSIFIVLPVLYFCNIVEGNLFRYYIRNYIFCLNNRHLWYIIVLFSIFLIARLLGDSLNKHSYFYFVLFLILSVLPSIPLLDYFKINKTLHMILFFYLGYLLTDEHDLRINKSVVLLFSILFTTVFWYWSINISDADILHKGLAVVLRQISAMLGILMMYTLSDIVFKGGAFAGVVSKHLLKNSYGIYLFHPMIIYLLAHFLPNTIDSFLACLIMFFVSIIISDILTELMRITRLRMFIGESK